MVRGRSYPKVEGLAIGADNHTRHDQGGDMGRSRELRGLLVDRGRRLNETEAVHRFLCPVQRCEQCRVRRRLSNKFDNSCLEPRMLVFSTFVGPGKHAVAELLIIRKKTGLVHNSSVHFQWVDLDRNRPTTLVKAQRGPSSPRVRIGFEATQTESLDFAVLDLPWLPCFRS